VEIKVDTQVMDHELSRIHDPLDVELFDDLAIRIYPDNRPNNLEIAGLHKGLILVHRCREMVEEGAGFGMPVVRYRDKTYFSSSAQVFAMLDEGYPRVLRKSFLLDTVSRKRLGNGPTINDSFYHVFHNIFTKAYHSLKGMRSLFDQMMEIRRSSRIETYFQRVRPRGLIDITYGIYDNMVGVSVDASRILRDGCEEIVILNEQGADYFRNYRDSSGSNLEGRGIGAWDRVEASEARLINLEMGIQYSLNRKEGAEVYRGWEKVKKGLSWAGMSYIFKPDLQKLDYMIRIDKTRKDIENS
jgi:hypothetical protein